MAQRRRGTCPRCGRDIALQVDGSLYRHKSVTDVWCTTEPKRSVEIIVEILKSLDAERELLRELTDSWLAQGETLVRISGATQVQRETTVELLRQGGAAVQRELAELEARQ